MINQPINTDWIRDIEPDPKFAVRMADLMSDAVEEYITDFAMQIATDYVEYPTNASESEIEAFEDSIAESVINPLYDRILDAVIAELRNGTP